MDYRVRYFDRTKAVVRESTAAVEGFYSPIREEDRVPYTLPVKGRVIIPYLWVAYMAAKENLRTKIKSVEMMETISGRWILDAIEDGLDTPIKPVDANMKAWKDFPTFVLASTKGDEDILTYEMPFDSPIQFWEMESIEQIKTGEGRILYYLNEGYLGPQVRELVKGDKPEAAWRSNFKGSWERERLFNITLMNMCRKYLHVKSLLTKNEMKPNLRVDALLS